MSASLERPEVVLVRGPLLGLLGPAGRGGRLAGRRVVRQLLLARGAHDDLLLPLGGLGDGVAGESRLRRLDLLHVGDRRGRVRVPGEMLRGVCVGRGELHLLVAGPVAPHAHKYVLHVEPYPGASLRDKTTFRLGHGHAGTSEVVNGPGSRQYNMRRADLLRRVIGREINNLGRRFDQRAVAPGEARWRDALRRCPPWIPAAAAAAAAICRDRRRL